MSSQTQTFLSGRFPAMQHSDYRALWLGAVASAVSLWAMLMARAWIAFDLSDSGLSIGAVTFAAMAPWMLAPVGGALADRFDRARLVMAGRIVQLLLALGIATLAFLDLITVWHLILFAFAGGLAWSVEMPAQNALLPNTIDTRSLLSAITLASMATFGSRLIGPLIGGPMLAGLGAGWIFVLAAGFYALSIWQVARIRIRSHGQLQRTGRGLLADAGVGVVEALRHVGRRPGLRTVIAVVSVHCMLTMSFDSLLPILARREFGGGSSLFSALLMGVGGGALIGTIVLSQIGSGRIRGRLFLASGIVSGLGLTWVGLAPTPVLAVAGTAVAGASQAIFVTLGAAFLQANVPDAMRGRLMSLYALFAGGVMAIMIFSNGAAADVVGVRVLLVVPSLVFVAVLLGWALLGRDLRRLCDTGEVDIDVPQVVAPAAAGGR